MSRKTILIVEDNDVQREGLGVVLRNAGYNALLSADAREAVAILKRVATPDLILLDMMIPPPAKDGWYFMRARQRAPALASVPVAIMTAMGIAGDEWAKTLGACELIRKPVEGAPLLEAVRRCLGEGQG